MPTTVFARFASFFIIHLLPERERRERFGSIIMFMIMMKYTVFSSELSRRSDDGALRSCERSMGHNRIHRDGFMATPTQCQLFIAGITCVKSFPLRLVEATSGRL